MNCALTFGRPGGGFAALNGDVRNKFTIDGKAPATPPKRNPLRQDAKPGEETKPSAAPSANPTPAP